MEGFSRDLLAWYDLNRRTLPWRGSRNPYVIWISEIIFQQTRISQGTSYFLRFMERFPTLESLASTDEEEVLKVWQGLGYYSRARNLHATAKNLVQNYGGQFPLQHNEIAGLKGIGDYTASCITSICFNQPDAAVDGNVYRVLSRVYEVGVSIDVSSSKRLFKEYAQALIDRNRPGDFNEAMMDLGAMICSPTSPDCLKCPVKGFCKAYGSGTQSQYPVRTRQKDRKRMEINYFACEKDGDLLIRKRSGKGIWHGLYDLPEAIGNGDQLVAEKVHPLSHADLFIRFYRGPELPQSLVHEEGMKWVSRDALKGYPFPKPVADFLDEIT